MELSYQCLQNKINTLLILTVLLKLIIKYCYRGDNNEKKIKE